MLSAFQKDRYNVIKRYAHNNTIQNKAALNVLLKATRRSFLKDAAFLACLRNMGQDTDVIQYFYSIFQGFPQDIFQRSEQTHTEQKMDAQAIYRQALIAFGYNPQDDPYFKQKQQENINESIEPLAK